MPLKISYYFQLFEGESHEKAVAINSGTGGTYAFEKNILPQLKGLLDAPDSFPESPLKQFLLDEGIIINKDLDELEEIKKRHRNGRNSKEELYITYSLTNACNFRCSYCYQEHSKSSLDENNFEKTFLYVEREIKNYDRLMVHWFGGEPLLRLKWLTSASERLMSICERLGKPYYAGITTNGSLFSKQTAILLKKLGVKQVQFTLDGEQAVHNTLRLHKSGKGTYDFVMSAIQNAIDEDFTIFLRINLSLRAVCTFEKLVSDLKSRGFDGSKIFVYINEMKQHSNSLTGGGIYFQSVAEYAEDFVRCLNVLKRHGYSLPRIEPVDVNCAFDKPSSVLFGVDGNLYHCTTGTDRALGELDANGEIAASSSRREAIHSREPWDDPHCTTCKSLPTCMGGCAYLDEEGKTKCNPEGFVVEQLLRTHLNATQ